jgi:hypothetical protein
MLLTMASQYYRVIDIPEAFFGLLGSGLAMLGFVVPGIARRLVAQRSPLFSWLIAAVLILFGLAGMSMAWPVVGILPAMLLFSSMHMVGFFLSHYLNKEASSEQRATVLSFKGLFLNLGYGAIGLFYSLLLYYLRQETIAHQPALNAEELKNVTFIASLPWFFWYFAALLIVLLIFFVRYLRQQKK